MARLEATTEWLRRARAKRDESEVETDELDFKKWLLRGVVDKRNVKSS